MRAGLRVFTDILVTQIGQETIKSHLFTSLIHELLYFQPHGIRQFLQS